MNGQANPVEPLVPRSPLQKGLALIIRHPWTILILFAAVTVAFGWSLPRLRIGTSVHDLVIEDLRETAHYQAFKQVFESDEIIRIVVRSDNIFTPDTFRRLTEFADQSSRINGVRRVISLPDIKQTVDASGRLGLAEFAHLIAPVRLFDRNLISTDNRASVITLVLDNDAASDAVIDAVADLIQTESGPLEIYQIGMPLVSRSLADYTSSDLLRLPPITLAIIALILFTLFRNVACLLLPLMAVIAAQVWTFGLMSWLGIPMTMLTMIVPVFLIAVGTAYCLYLCSEFLATAQQAASAKAAVYRTFSKLAFPTALAVVTTIVGLGSLSINRIEAIREFALMACFGMLSLLVILLTAFPAALTLFPPPTRRPQGLGPADKLLARLIDKVIRLNTVHQKAVFTTLAIVAVICLVGVFRMRVETNPVEYFRETTTVRRNFHDIYRDLSGSFPLNIVMAGNLENYFEDVTNIKDIERLQTYLEALPGVDKVITFAGYLKLVNYVLNKFDAKYYVLPEEGFELRMLINNFNVVLGNDTLNRFMTPDFSRTNLLMMTHLSSSRDFLNTREKILAHVKKDFAPELQFDVTGLGIAISASSHLLTSGQIKSLLLTFVLIFAMMALLFFSTKVGFIALLPTVFPVILNFGFMGWLGINLSVATSLIASIAIGLAVDDTIHYLFRYHSEFKKDLDKDRAMKDTLLSVGRPIITTSVTIACGFAILMISHFKPTGLFGLLMVVTMMAALVSALVLLPGLMLNVELVTAWDLLKWIPALGGIPPGVAHELKQPLNTIKVGSEYLKRTIGQNKPLDQQLLTRVVSEISVQVDRSASIIDRLIEMEPTAGVETEWVNLNLPIQDTLTIVGNELKLDDIKLETSWADQLPPVRANSQRLAQVFFNLITNAREAVNEKQSAASSGERRISIRTFQEGNRSVATIADTGVGIPTHFKERVFEPFFSTKAAGKGKGLGLAICHQIVKSYDGRIVIDSTEDLGTTVTVSFPVPQPAAGEYLP